MSVLASIQKCKTAAAGIPGGRADGMSDSSFDPKSVKKGTKVEYEHTPDKDKAKDIAKDHLAERKDYYEKLERMEKSPKQKVAEAFFDELEKIAMGAKMLGLATSAGMKGMQSGGQQAAKAARVGFKLSNKGEAGQAGAKMIFGVRKTAGAKVPVQTAIARMKKTVEAMKSSVSKLPSKPPPPKVKTSEIASVELARKQHAVQNHQELMKSMKPGDLVFSAPHRSKANGFMGRVFKPLSRMVQGTDFGHTAMYIGDGNIIDTRIGRKVKSESLQKLTAKNNVVAVRPKDVTPEERKQAVEYAKSHIGTPYSKRALLRAATPFQGKFKGKGPEESNHVMCSGLAANAYAKRKFAPVSRKYIRPSQILGSNQVTPVAYMETAKQPGLAASG